MQTSILNFISKRQEPVGSLALNGEHSPHGPKQDDCRTSGEAGAATGGSITRPSANLPMLPATKTKRARSEEAKGKMKTMKHQQSKTNKERPLKRSRNTPGLNQSTLTFLPGSSSNQPVLAIIPGCSLSTPKLSSYTPRPGIPCCVEIAQLNLIASAKPSCRFFNESLQGVYASCILPTLTKHAASHTISSSAYSNATVRKSLWTHTIHHPPRANVPKTSCLSLPFLAHACTVVEAVQPEVEEEDPNEPKKKPMPFQRKDPMKGRPRSYKNRILPTKEQVVELKRAFAAARTAYNFANKRVRDENAAINIIKLKKDWVRAEKNDYIKGVSSRICSLAINELVASYKSNETKRRKKPDFTYEVKDRTMNARSEVVHIERGKVLLEVVPVQVMTNGKRCAECGLRFGNNFEKVGALRIQGKSKIIKKIVKAGANLHAAAMIRWDKIRNAFYFIWIDDMEIPSDPDPAFENKTIVSLDPGSAPFQQWYSPTSGEFGELLSGTSEVLKRRRWNIDKLRKRVQRRVKAPQTLVTKRRKTFTRRKRTLKRQRTTKQLKQKLAREQQRVSSYMEAAHYDAAHFLLKHHDIVIAPVLQTGWMMQKKNRKTGPKLSRTLHMWAHRLFRQRLAYTAARYPGRFVFECAEPGTSKTCTNCGAWKDSLRLGDKVYSCSHCRISVDRQIAGARNNFFAAYGMAVGLGWDGVGG